MKIAMMAVFVLCFWWHLFAGEAEARVTAKVVDESRNPVNGAKVIFGYEHLKTSNPWDGRTNTCIEGVTDSNGLVTVSSSTMFGVGISVLKDGFYESMKGCNFKSQEFGKWQPWNPTIEIVLRKILNPVPMYAKNFSLINVFKIPVVDEPAGYDLMIGDWVKPHGKGEISDIVFLLKRELKDEMNFESKLDISTTRQGDGFAPITPEMTIYESDFKLPYEALQDGYGKSLLLSFSASSDTPNKNNFVSGYKRTCEPEGKNFFIRIRSEADGDGNVIKAIYGIILGPIEYRIQESKTATLRFKYHINPDYTRNIEFDSKRNLFDKKYDE